MKIKFHKRKVAEYINDYVIYSASVLNLPPCSGRFGYAHVIDLYHKQNISDNIFGLVNVTVKDMSNILNSISASKATGLDELPAILIKQDSSVVAKPFTHIVNLSITTGYIPDDLKVARVVPLYKKVTYNNYTPIPMLNIRLNSVRKTLFTQLNDFLTKQKLLYEFQSG